MIILMFIGASPGSTGAASNNHVSDHGRSGHRHDAWAGGYRLFRYRLVQERIFKALTITLLALLFIITVTMILSTTEDSNFDDII